MIALDARMIAHSGIGTYIRGLLSGFSQEQFRRIVLIGDPQKLAGYPCRVLPAFEPVYGVGEQFFLPRRLKTLAPDLYHVPHYNIPWGYAGRLVVTVHDLIHLLFPEFSRHPLARYYAKILLRRAAKKSVKIVADSECTRRDLIRFGADPEKIDVISLAVENGLKRVEAAQAAPHLARYGLTPGYILYVGNIRKIKNVSRLLDAYKILKTRRQDVPPLVLAGRNQWPGLNDSLREHPSVRWLGEVANDSLPSLYSSASVFVFPSLYEGFGLPPLEAMACGCPVVASTGGSLPEVLGDSALLVDPLRTDELAEALKRVLDDSSLRETLISKGFQKARMFSWKDTAARTFKVYEDILSPVSKASTEGRR